MTDNKLTDLTAIGTIADDDILYIVDTSTDTSHYVTVATIDARYIAAGSLATVATSGDYGDLSHLPTLGTLAAIDDAPSDGSQYARQDGDWAEVAAGVSLPVVDTTAIVYQTGDVTKTAKFSATALTAARTYTLPNADTTLAGLGVVQTFTAAQTFSKAVIGAETIISPSIGATQYDLSVTYRGTLPATTTGSKFATTLANSTGGGTHIGASYDYKYNSDSPSATSVQNFSASYTHQKGLGNIIEVFDITASKTGGTIYHLYGLFINNISGANNSNYAIYTNAGAVSIGDAVTVRSGNLAVSDGTFSTVKNSTATDAIVNMATIGVNSTGTAAAGFGPAVVLTGESSTTNDRTMARLAALWNVPTDASRSADLVGYASDSAAEREIWRGRATGTAAAIGFLGATPAVRQTGGAVTAGGTWTATEQAMLQAAYDALRTFGLLT